MNKNQQKAVCNIIKQLGDLIIPIVIEYACNKLNPNHSTENNSYHRKNSNLKKYSSRK